MSKNKKELAWKKIQLSLKGMSVRADGNNWKGRTKNITSLLHRPKHGRSPDWPGNHHLHTADKKREMPRNKMTLLFHANSLEQIKVFTQEKSSTPNAFTWYTCCYSEHVWKSNA